MTYEVAHLPLASQDWGEVCKEHVKCVGNGDQFLEMEVFLRFDLYYPVLMRFGRQR